MQWYTLLHCWRVILICLEKLYFTKHINNLRPNTPENWPTVVGKMLWKWALPSLNSTVDRCISSADELIIRLWHRNQKCFVTDMHDILSGRLEGIALLLQTEWIWHAFTVMKWQPVLFISCKFRSTDAAQVRSLEHFRSSVCWSLSDCQKCYL